MKQFLLNKSVRSYFQPFDFSSVVSQFYDYKRVRSAAHVEEHGGRWTHSSLRKEKGNKLFMSVNQSISRRDEA